MYGYTMRVAQDIATYHALHRAIVGLAGYDYDGLVLHLAAPTAQGFELTEVWDSKERLDAFNREVLPAALRVAGVAMDLAAAQVSEFTPAVVLTPQAYNSDDRQGAAPA